MPQVCGLILPEPDCEMGYTEDQVANMFGSVGLQKFNTFMQGSTIALCDGKSKCKHLSKHTIFYTKDVNSFVACKFRN